MNKRWITGKEILERWNGAEFEILEAFKNGLPAYKRDTGEPITYKSILEGPFPDGTPNNGLFEQVGKAFLMLHGSTSQPQLVIDFLLNSRKTIFSKQEVQEHEQEHGIEPTSTAGEEQGQPPTVNTRQEKQEQYSIDVPDGTTWDQIHIRVVNAHYIEVSYPGAGSHENISREKIGLTEKPWNYFIKLARDRGEYIPADEDEKRLAPAHFKEIRKILKELFPKISGKPIVDQDRRTGIYEAAFSISLDPELENSEEIQDAIGDDDSKRKEIEQLFKEQQEDMNRH